MPTDLVRIAEPWTAASIAGGMVLAVLLVALVVWLIRRSARS
jgi:flagellar biogenesis protein FliO